MTVAWKQTALDDREEFLSDALLRAIAKPDPQIYAAALASDNHIEAEGDALDGLATYKPGPLPGSHVYPTKDGRHVILYQRNGNHVEIERVRPSNSNWQP